MVAGGGDDGVTGGDAGNKFEYGPKPHIFFLTFPFH